MVLSNLLAAFVSTVGGIIRPVFPGKGSNKDGSGGVAPQICSPIMEISTCSPQVEHFIDGIKLDCLGNVAMMGNLSVGV